MFRSFEGLSFHMGREPLKNKPLVEAILEVHWDLKAVKAQGMSAIGIPAGAADGATVLRLDPHFRLLLGRVFDRIGAEYPTHEPLPSSYLPDGVLGEVVQHRFRHTDNWPIIQLGPGILTVNDTDKYKWEDFAPRCKEAVRVLFDAHPKVTDLRVSSLVLRYIDAVGFDYLSEDIGDFLSEKMAVKCRLPDALFADSKVNRAPTTFRWETSYRCEQPAGRMTILLATGAAKEQNALIWETVFQSADGDLPTMPSEFEAWLHAAHDVADDWFFKLIEGGSGDLKRRFKGAT